MSEYKFQIKDSSFKMLGLWIDEEIEFLIGLINTNEKFYESAKDNERFKKEVVGAMIIVIYRFVENYTMRFATWSERGSELPVKIKDFSGTGIPQAIKYLNIQEEFLELRYVIQNQDMYKKMEVWRYLRNHIAHNGYMYIEKDDRNFKKILKFLKDTGIDHYYNSEESDSVLSVYFKFNDCRTLLALCSDFLYELLRVLDGYYAFE